MLFDKKSTNFAVQPLLEYMTAVVCQLYDVAKKFDGKKKSDETKPTSLLIRAMADVCPQLIYPYLTRFLRFLNHEVGIFLEFLLTWFPRYCPLNINHYVSLPFLHNSIFNPLKSSYPLNVIHQKNVISYFEITIIITNLAFFHFKNEIFSNRRSE